MSNHGILVQSDIKKPKLRDEIVTLLRNVSCKIKIKCVIDDPLGYKVYFDDASAVQKVLQRKFLAVPGYDENFSLYPVTTNLIVQNVIPCPFRDVKEDLAQVMNDNFGPVLNLYEIPLSKNYPDISSGNWRVALDIPEINNLEVFKRNGFPKMTIKLPVSKCETQVKFFCAICEEDGHTRMTCREPISAPSSSSSSKTVANKKKPIKPTDEPKVKDNFADKSSESFPLPHGPGGGTFAAASMSKTFFDSVPSFACRVGSEEVMRRSEFFSSNKDPKHASLNTRAEEKIYPRKRVRETTPIKKEKVQQHPAKKFFPDLKLFTNPRGMLTEVPLSFSKASSTTKDDEDNVEAMQLTTVSSKTGGIAADDPILRRDVPLPLIKTEKEDETVVTNTPSSSGPETNSATRKPKRTNSVTDVSSASEASKKRTRQSATISAEVIRGPLIEECVRNAPGVLDRNKLQIFFVHAKKKTNLIQIAERYTSNIDGLRDQLKKILQNYYSSPDTGSAEDIRFIKWLDGLEKRFDGPATKIRKRRDLSPPKIDMD